MTLAESVGGGECFGKFLLAGLPDQAEKRAMLMPARRMGGERVGGAGGELMPVVPFTDFLFHQSEIIHQGSIGSSEKLQNRAQLFYLEPEGVQIACCKRRPVAQPGCVAGRSGVNLLFGFACERGGFFAFRKMARILLEVLAGLAAMAVNGFQQLRGVLFPGRFEICEQCGDGFAVLLLRKRSGERGQDIHVADVTGGLAQGADGFAEAAGVFFARLRQGRRDGFNLAGAGAQLVNGIRLGVAVEPAQGLAKLAKRLFGAVESNSHGNSLNPHGRGWQGPPSQLN